MEKIFQVKHLFYKVDETTILKDINLEIQKGKYITVVGPSGSGKSTLMRILASMISPTSGEVIFDGKSIETYDPILYRQKVSYAFQQPTLFGKTVRENLEFPFEVRKEAVDETKIIDYLKMVNLDDSYIDKSVNDVSGGEKQRIALLRNLLFPPEVLITDEEIGRAHV